MNVDYVIVGAGSAGCVLANRLSADPRKRVLLLEAGPASRNPWLRIPGGMKALFAHPTLNWRYYTQPEPNLDDRRLYWPRGKTLGGSSAINGMGYVRGHPADYEHWRQLGNEGWSWEDVAPVYRSMERYENGDPTWHGTAGDLSVSEARTKYPVSRAFIAAAQAAGIAETPDFNTDRQEGAGFYKFSIRRGLRDSSAQAFLDPARSRPNLSIVSGATTERILLEESRAVGVAYRVGTDLREVRAGEVIVAAGAVNAPQLLMLSGIGPAGHLAEHDIPVAADLPGVGGNLQDHLYIHHLVDVAPGWSANSSMRGAGAVRQALEFLLRRRGLLSLGASQSGAFVRSDERLDRPDLQFMFKAYSLKFGPDGRSAPSSTPGVTTSISQVRPLSHGRISLASADPAVAPVIRPNYLAEEADRTAMIAGLRWVRRIFAEQPLAALSREETAPGPGCETDDQLLAFIRGAAQSMYHPVGTCRMGRDPHAVVDARLRVHKVDRLRVADASIMPTIPAGNTNAPSMMIGAKAASMILDDAA